jgi:hypothetical protein
MPLDTKPSQAVPVLWRDVICPHCNKKRAERISILDVLGRHAVIKCPTCEGGFTIPALEGEDLEKALEAERNWHTLKGTVAKINRLEIALGCLGVVTRVMQPPNVSTQRRKENK